MNYYSFHIGDFVAATVHLSAIEELAYRRLLDMYYDTEQPIPLETDRVSRRLRLDIKTVETVLSEFFDKTEDGYRNARCDQEIAAYKRKADQARANGKAGGRPKKTNPVPIRNQAESGSKANQEPITNNQEYIDTDVSIVASKLPTPNCPHQEIINLYHKHLPELPYPRIWEGARAKNLAARWKWALTAKREDGTRYATDEQSGLEFFERFFAYVAKSDFLTGRSGKWQSCDLEWLTKAGNFAKVISGNYENRASS